MYNGGRADQLGRFVLSRRIARQNPVRHSSHSVFAMELPNTPREPQQRPGTRPHDLDLRCSRERLRSGSAQRQTRTRRDGGACARRRRYQRGTLPPRPERFGRRLYLPRGDSWQIPRDRHRGRLAAALDRHHRPDALPAAQRATGGSHQHNLYTSRSVGGSTTAMIRL